jgi:hypothetical protein
MRAIVMVRPPQCGERGRRVGRAVIAVWMPNAELVTSCGKSDGALRGAVPSGPTVRIPCK